MGKRLLLQGRIAGKQPHAFSGIQICVRNPGIVIRRRPPERDKEKTMVPDGFCQQQIYSAYKLPRRKNRAPFRSIFLLNLLHGIPAVFRRNTGSPVGGKQVSDGPPDRPGIHNFQKSMICGKQWHHLLV